MIMNFQFWQHCGLELQVLISGKSLVTCEVDFEQLQ